MKVKTSILLLLMIATTLPSFGGNGNGNGTDSLQATRYVTRATMYGVGYTNVFDTYLSPQEYKGIEFRISRETMRMTTLGDGNVSVQNFFQANLAYTHNRVDNNNTFAGLVNWNYGLHYQFRITDNFKLLAGGMGDFNGGFVYNLRNTNNPASARAYINLDASGMAIWHTKIKNYPLALRYQVNLPVIGVMFSPPITGSPIMRYSHSDMPAEWSASPPYTISPHCGRCYRSTSRSDIPKCASAICAIFSNPN